MPISNNNKDNNNCCPVVYLAYNLNDGSVDLSDNIQMILMTTPLNAVFNSKNIASITNVNSIWDLGLIHIIKDNNLIGKPSQCKNNTSLLLFSRIPSFEAFNNNNNNNKYEPESIIGIIPPVIYHETKVFIIYIYIIIISIDID